MIICSLLMGKTLSSIQGECFAFYAVKYLFILLLLRHRSRLPISLYWNFQFVNICYVYIYVDQHLPFQRTKWQRGAVKAICTVFVEKLFLFQVEKAEFLSKMLWKEITKYVAVVKFQNRVMTNVDKTGLSIQLN